MRNPLAAAVLVVSLMVPTVAQPSLLDQVWSFLSALWGGVSADEGCTADPDGRCLPVDQSESDAGCIADPDGRCLPVEQPEADAGCIADPNGCPLNPN